MKKGGNFNEVWARVSVSKNCWIWTGYTNKDGYGVVYWRRRRFSAHRLIWKFAYGNIPNGYEVCHKCDVPACVRPDHLFLGTHMDNIKDCIRKGRWTSLKGEENGNAKLTESQVREIRAIRGMRYDKIASLYGVSYATISGIRRRISWKNVD